MRVPILSDAVCACGHRGMMSMSALCLSCGAAPSDRVTPVRMRVLVNLARLSPRDPPLYIEPGVRIWLASHGLIAATEPRVAPSDARRARRPVRRHAPTERGMAILQAAGICAVQTPSGSLMSVPAEQPPTDEQRLILRFVRARDEAPMSEAETRESLGEFGVDVDAEFKILMKSVAAQEESDRLQESAPGHADHGDP